MMCVLVFVFYLKQKTAYEMRISDWSSDVCSSDLPAYAGEQPPAAGIPGRAGAAGARPRDRRRFRRRHDLPGICREGDRPDPQDGSSEERRVGTAGVSTSTPTWSPYA